ncbi:uncharacterized protein LOC116850377 isoform X2 [Odontomachus brunneus]|uniref:uncharacterized protein LOC116850377 isoform X2 n=1 Tax=Odontomachus brunneus TaxID=486640 RepID=UPI0013F23A0A|nr:uncharacterized protein LOC116850377 isoform X2 [Odontomachus brunneus]
MPSVLVGASQCNQRMWQALKIHIMRERQRKKQADEEEERLRKERERQQKQDVMTFGETQEQINNLHGEISELEMEKHDLFTELKRVLHEEGTRKQFAKENNIYSEVSTVGIYSTVNTKVTHPQLLPTTRNIGSLHESSVVEQQILTTGSTKETFMPRNIPLRGNIFPTSVCKAPSSIPIKNPLSFSIENSIGPSKKNYDYSSIMLQPSRETPEQSKPTYPTVAKVSSLTTNPAYIAYKHSMEQQTSLTAFKMPLSMNEGHSVISNRSNILRDALAHHPPQSIKAKEATGYHVGAPAVTYDDTSNITLNRLLDNSSFMLPMSYGRFNSL